MREISVLNNAGRLREADSVVLVVERRRGTLSPYESAYFDFLRAVQKDDVRAQVEATERMVAAAPTAAFPKYVEATSLNDVGQERRALAVLDSLDPMSGGLRGRIYFYQY